ncbi:MAG TPA: DUF3662 and FHA domain-containing protein [Actinomycetota bacterium]|nr:DUF3662 and FHA domain-containing protein [Actinomycetota bacterium]
MGVAKSIERRLEGLVEGFFTKVFRSGLQPVEIGRRILREMAENKTVSVNRIYAPNEFTVYMGSDDYARFTQMEAGLQREFSELVIDAAKENRWNLMGVPRISFRELEDLKKGEFRVEAALTADPDVPKGAHRVQTREPGPGDASATRAISVDTADRLGISNAGATLVVLDDSGKPKERISITRAPVTIGRLSTSDVVLADSNVSRRHAEIRRDSSGWVLVDLGSTNGSLVNGKLAKEHALKHGDRISIGTSELLFETDKAD